MPAFLLFIVAIVAIVVATAALQYRARQSRMRSAASVARGIGFSFSPADTEHLVDLPFGILSKGNRRAVEFVMSGTHDGLPLHMFDYWYRVDSGRNSTYYRFTCALATIPAACPRLRLGHENVLTRLESDVGLGDIELEYDDFNRRFRVKSADQKFAFSLLDAKLMDWLLSDDHFDSVEIDGPWILLVHSRIDPPGWLDLGTWLGAFARQIPPVVFSTYPPK